jgi:hypothetical protein
MICRGVGATIDETAMGSVDPAGFYAGIPTRYSSFQTLPEFSGAWVTACSAWRRGLNRVEAIVYQSFSTERYCVGLRGPVFLLAPAAVSGGTVAG